MNRDDIFALIKQRRTFLCVGLDTDLEKIPEHLRHLDDPVFEFNRQIIDATRDLCVAYKPNLAFYEALGAAGWKSLERTMAYIGDTHFTIADAKRGDIGNTSLLYARAFFKTMNFDAVTVAPYMGHDSVTPFLSFDGKWVILLGLTSNQGALDFQFLPLEISKLRLFEKVIRKSAEWGNADNMMYVVGATRGELIADVRNLIPDHFLLVPGVGAQGGDLEEVVKYGMNDRCGLLVNASRSILYASSGTDFAQAARNEAMLISAQMETHLKAFKLVS
jgi:orotidine-5'-phosphate decarboxylase